MHRLLSRSVLLALVVQGIACSGSKEPQSAARPAPPAEAVSRSAPSTATATAPAAPGIPEQDVRALVDTWVAAQNRGDFDAYAALYAARFQGVRRNADRTQAFDRVGWMKDRRRMFRRPMVVAASDVVVESTASSVGVTFRQRWSSGSYADEGQKRLLIVQEAGGLKIAVEEMLAAERTGDLDTALALGTFVALPSRDGPLAILAEAPESAATGAASMLTSDDPFVAAKAPSASVPASVTALVGRDVTVIERRRTCPGTVESIRVVSLVIPHFGTVAEWNGQPEGEPQGTPMSDVARAADAWTLAHVRHYAAVVRSECTDPVALTLAPRAGVVVYVPREPTQAERGSLTAAFERTRRFAAREAAYTDYLAEIDPSDEEPAAPGQRAAWRSDSSTVVFEAGARRIGTVVQNAGGCGGFNVSGWAGFELAGAASTELREPTPLGDYISVMAVFDVDGDGDLEAIVRRDLASYGLVRLTPTSTLLRRVDVDYFDCPC